MKKVMFAAVFASLVLSGCAHSVMRGTVAMKTGEREAHVCMGKDEVKAGDRVQVYKNNCIPKSGKLGSGPSCTKELQGEGTVSSVLNDHYSVVTFDAGVPFDEGTFVEKKK